jgi:ribosomal subunit interface protein
MVTQNITFKHTNSDTDASIRPLVEQKLAGLEKYIGNETDVRTEVEFEKVASHRSGAICRVEVNIFVGGDVYRSETVQETFEAALDIVKDELDQEMRRAHKKRNSLIRRGGRKLKEMIRFGK